MPYVDVSILSQREIKTQTEKLKKLNYLIKKMW